MIFLHKPILHIPYSQIALIQVQRGSDLSAANRFFDLSVVVANGTVVQEFRHVSRDELQPLLKALKSRGVQVPEIEIKGASAGVVDPLGDSNKSGKNQNFQAVADNSDDSDYEPGEGDDGEDEEDEWRDDDEEEPGRKRRR